MLLRNTLKAGIAAIAMMSAPAMADNHNDGMANKGDMASAMDMWERVNNQTVSAQRMMSGDVTNNMNPIGDVDNLVLDPTGTRIEYVLYDVPFPYSFYGEENGFVRWQNVELERGVGVDVDLRIQSEDQSYGKEELQITRAEADDRLVDRIISGDIRFADGETRGIDDMLFDPETGYVTHYVVEMDDESLFGNDNRLVPASMVTLNEDADFYLVSQPVNYDYEVWIY